MAGSPGSGNSDMQSVAWPTGDIVSGLPSDEVMVLWAAEAAPAANAPRPRPWAGADAALAGQSAIAGVQTMRAFLTGSTRMVCRDPSALVVRYQKRSSAIH